MPLSRRHSKQGLDMSIWVDPRVMLLHNMIHTCHATCLLRFFLSTTKTKLAKFMENGEIRRHSNEAAPAVLPVPCSTTLSLHNTTYSIWVVLGPIYLCSFPVPWQPWLLVHFGHLKQYQSTADLIWPWKEPVDGTAIDQCREHSHSYPQHRKAWHCLGGNYLGVIPAVIVHAVFKGPWFWDTPIYLHLETRNDIAGQQSPSTLWGLLIKNRVIFVPDSQPRYLYNVWRYLTVAQPWVCKSHS